MSIGLVGRKCGMTRIFTEDGVSIPVTVIEVLPNRIVQVKTPATDGYSAIQVTTGEKKASRVNKPAAGHFAKAGVLAGRGLWEFRLDGDSDSEGVSGGQTGFTPGAELNLSLFTEGQLVDVTSFCSKGKGFAGTMKRHGFAGGDATHGNSLSHRAPGSIGQRQSPGKVFKGKKMSGQMGAVRRTIQMQPIIRLDAERNLVFVRGGVPGGKGGNLLVLPAKKANKAKKAGEKGSSK